ncbi:UspA domain-containing protein [Natronococcus amylolyticus DSM 10524]|uniref:UspA domain-containing protein n=1 Tax=Natronococcus amylolyticus DSM 10524 TaxID=1227497 RepID=L9X2W6_9EURY|nr:UspA domain-containing protein [Natronococcus amylolyticus DSM 10524]
MSALETLEESGVTVVARREHSDRRTLSSKWPHVDADNIVICGHERILVGKTLFGSVTQLVLLSADRPVTITVE